MSKKLTVSDMNKAIAEAQAQLSELQTRRARLRAAIKYFKAQKIIIKENR